MVETNSCGTAREAMHRYGYPWDGMDPIEERGRASDLYEEGHAVYMLYPDGTEAEAEDPSEITEHEGLFGIETAEGGANPDTTSPAAAIETPLGTLRAEIMDSEPGYPGIRIILDKEDGSSGVASWTEVTREGVLQTHCYDGISDEPYTMPCHPCGPWMSEPDAPSPPRRPSRPRRP